MQAFEMGIEKGTKGQRSKAEESSYPFVSLQLCPFVPQVI
jgi:hypothetical protein